MTNQWPINDRESKEKLVAKFYKHAWPFRRNKTLMFGFMYIEKGLSWYKKILNLTLPEPRDIKINPKNCIGTVLSLNGHRRYFCMYHAKVLTNYNEYYIDQSANHRRVYLLTDQSCFSTRRLFADQVTMLPVDSSWDLIVRETTLTWRWILREPRWWQQKLFH